MGKRIIRRFDSIAEMVRYVDEKRDRACSSSRVDESGHAGTRTFEEARDLALKGWSAERPKVDAILKPLRESLADKLSAVTVRQHDLVGYEPDIDRYVAGELECMWDDFVIEAPKQGNVYTVLVSGSVPSFTSGDEILRRGVAIVGLIEAFQMLGYDLEVWIENSVTSESTRHGSGGDSWSSLCRVHKAGENMDVNAIMFPLANAAWQRRMSFGCREGEDAKTRQKFGITQGGTYGYTADLLCADVIDGLSFTLTRGGTQGTQMERDPLGFVLGMLAAQGVYEPAE